MILTFKLITKEEGTVPTLDTGTVVTSPVLDLTTKRDNMPAQRTVIWESGDF